MVLKVEYLNAFTREFLSFNVTDRLSEFWQAVWYHHNEHHTHTV